MRNYIIFFAFILAYKGSTQPTITKAAPCSYTLHFKGDEYSKYKYESYSDFLEKHIEDNYPNAELYITSSPLSLKQFKVKKTSDDKLDLSVRIKCRGTIETTITIKRDSFYVDLPTITKDDYLLFENVIADSLAEDYYGFVKEQDHVIINRIDSISISTRDWSRTISGTFLNKLVNPNFHEKRKLAKPIEVFYDSSTESVYIYIYGLIPDDITIFDRSSSVLFDSYVTKIIVNQDSVLDITLPSKYLIAYGWLDCPHFWPL